LSIITEFPSFNVPFHPRITPPPPPCFPPPLPGSLVPNSPLQAFCGIQRSFCQSGLSGPRFFLLVHFRCGVSYKVSLVRCTTFFTTVILIVSFTSHRTPGSFLCSRCHCRVFYNMVLVGILREKAQRSIFSPDISYRASGIIVSSLSFYSVPWKFFWCTFALLFLHQRFFLFYVAFPIIRDMRGTPPSACFHLFFPS